MSAAAIAAWLGIWDGCQDWELSEIDGTYVDVGRDVDGQAVET